MITAPAALGLRPDKTPHGVRFFVRVGAIRPPGDPAAFAAAAPRLIVFRVDPLAATDREA